MSNISIYSLDELVQYIEDISKCYDKDIITLINDWRSARDLGDAAACCCMGARNGDKLCSCKIRELIYENKKELQSMIKLKYSKGI